MLTEKYKVQPLARSVFYALLMMNASASSSEEINNSSWMESFSDSVTGQWQQEWAGDAHDSQKMESQLQLEWEKGFNTGIFEHTALTMIGRLRMDTEGHLSTDDPSGTYSEASRPWIKTGHTEFELREFYLDAEWFDLYWRLGKQQVVWGQADGLKVLDVVTPQSYREFILDDFDDSRIPLWMVNVEWLTSPNSSLQFIWIPDTTYHDLAQTDTLYAVTSPLKVPSFQSIQQPVTGINQHDPRKPNNWLKDSDAGLRYSQFWKGWDITLNYFYHYRDFYAPYQSLEYSSTNGGESMLNITPEYERSHLVGGTASNAFGDFTLRTEIGWYSHSYQVSRYTSDNHGIEESPELTSVIGLDWQGLSDTLVSVQWFQSLLLDYDSKMMNERNEQTLTLLLEHKLANDTWTLKLQGLYSLTHQDQLWRPKVSYLWQSNLEVWMGADLFSGTSDGLYGQFDTNDRLVLGIEWGF